MSPEADTSASPPAAGRRLVVDRRILRVVFWLVGPLIAATLVSIVIELFFSHRPLPTILLNNSFGWGLRAAVGLVSEWVGLQWLLDDSWGPMLRALQYLHEAGASKLYETVFFAESTKFQYPPTSLLPLDLAGSVIQLTAARLNILNSLVMLANAAAIAWLAWLVFARDAQRGDAPALDQDHLDPRAMAAIAFAAVWLYYPVTRAFCLGQVQLWIDLAFSLACIFWWTDRKLAAGITIALASALKPQLGVLLLWALIWGQRDFTIGMIIALIPIAGASLALYGWHNHVTYLDVLSYISHHGESYAGNQSFNGLVNRLLFNGSNLEWDAGSFAPYNSYVFAATLLASAFLMLLPLVSAFLLRGRQPSIFDYGLAALCFIMASPIAWEHHYGIMLPLFVVALRFAVDAEPGRLPRHTIALLTTAWLLTAGRYPAVNLLSSTLLNVFQSYVLFGGIIFLYLLREAGSAVAQSCPVSSAKAGKLQFP